MSGKIKTAIIGAAGYWAQNILRNVLRFEDVELKYCIDNNEKQLEKVKKKVPYNTQLVTDYQVCLADPELDAVLIVSPVSSHYRIARDCIKAKKNCCVQKPFVETAIQAIDLTTLARQMEVKLMTSFTYIFNPVITKIKELKEKEEIGSLYYYDSTRINLGLIQRDVNVIHDLFCHDAAILYYLTNELPQYISASGKSHDGIGLIDIANVNLNYEKWTSHVHVNWLSPQKNRTIILAGDKKMVVFDDCSNEKLKIYDTGFKSNGNVFDYRTGDITIPKISNEEAVYLELKHFFDCIKENKTPITDGEFSIQVLKMIDMANKSIELKGTPVSTV